MKTQSKNGGGRKKTRGATPELRDILAKKTSGRPKKTFTADQIADSFEEQARKFMDIANILRGAT